MEFREIYKCYKVSKCGTILSKRGLPMKTHQNGRGYLILNLRYKGRSLCKSVHRLVAEAWLPNPNNLSDVDHIDGDRLNNHVSNLRWVTHGQNIQHSYNLKNRNATGTKNANCKATEEDVRLVCRELEKNKETCVICKEHGFKNHFVYGIKHRQRWKHISKDYNF